jgi:hypothetical protein
MRFIVTHRSPIRPSPPARSPRPRPSRGGWNWRPQGSRRVDRNSHTTTLFINVPSFLHSFIPSLIHSLIHSFTNSFTNSFLHSFPSLQPNSQPQGLVPVCSRPLTPVPSPLRSSGARGDKSLKGVTRCERMLSSPLECDDLSSLWISEGAWIVGLWVVPTDVLAEA